ncbi:cytochrome P450 [Coniella lustricola]|uniref:Cytochrome P450 n=1 Tax=Coniella lustricola TaxID=2025994 RepID=A0A2T3AA15_9PEZI|nr:cytochrome P450 [Coniella lustricola]
MAVLLLLSTLVVAWASWQAIALAKSYREARAIGLPIIVSPTTTMSPLWLVVYRLTPILWICEQLPNGIGRWARYSRMGWQYEDKDAAHRELGPAFVLCTPGVNEVHLADPAAVHTVLRQRKEFVKPGIIYDNLNIFGRNVDSVEGEAWQKHRRLTAPSFNENLSTTVWQEATRQAGQMLQEWTKNGAQGTTKSAHDAATLALNVLTYAGMGVAYEFSEGKEEPRNNNSRKFLPASHRLSYRDSLNTVLRNFPMLLVLPKKYLNYSFLPASLRQVGEACYEFELYLKELVHEGKQNAKQYRQNGPGEQPAVENLLQALVRASETASDDTGSGDAPLLRTGLADDELYGNLFIYNMGMYFFYHGVYTWPAGHETTANAVATAIAYLASQPRCQDWLHQELDLVASEFGPDPHAWRYQDVYPRLVRCQAVMLETLRLNGSVVFLPKSTNSTDAVQKLTIAGKEHVLAANTWVITNSQALHCRTEIWGPDALVWRPDRWIIAKQQARFGEEGPAAGEELLEPRDGTYVPWAAGPRVCPGKKFAQVEFAGALAVLFAQHQVKPRRNNGESDEDSRRRAAFMVADSGIQSMTLQMKHPESVALVWTQRN